MAFTARTETYADVSSLSSPYDLTVNKPSGTAEGDILFALISWYSAVNTIDSVPSGWTKLADYTSNSDRYALYYKVGGASEPSSYTWSFSGSQRTRIVCCCYTSGDFNGADPIDVYSNTAYRINDTTVRAAGMTVTSANSPLVFFAGQYSAASRTHTKPSNPTSDWVEDDDAGSTTSWFWNEICSMIWTGSGGTGNMDATSSATTTTKHAFAVALKPSSGYKYGSATMSGTGTLAAIGRLIRKGAATMAGTGTLAAIGRRTRPGSATLSGTGSLAAGGAYLRKGTATMSGTGTLAGIGRLIKKGAATMSGAGTLAAIAKVTHKGSALMSGTGSLAATGRVTRKGSATLSGTGALAGIGRKTIPGSALMSGAGSLAAIGRLTRKASATMSGTGSLAAAATVLTGAIYGSATLSGTGTLAAAGNVTRPGSALMSGQGLLAASPRLILAASATIAGTGSLSAAGTIVGGFITGSAAISGTGTLHVSATAYFVSPTLLAAQKKPVRFPYVEAKLYDYSQGIKRLYYTRLYQGSEPDNHHGLAFDGQGAMHRVRAGADNKLYRQKVPNPGPSSDYSTWTEIAADCSGPCAIAACGARIYIFYRKTDNTLRKYYSHNYGQDWTNAELAAYEGVLSMAACWWSTGDVVACFALKTTQINAVLVDTSDQATTEHTWYDANHPWLDTMGLGATYDAPNDRCHLVVAAKESDSPYNHYDLFRTDFLNIHSFLALQSFLMAPAGEGTTYEYPDCHLPASAQEYESTRITAVEKYTGITAYVRPLTCHMVRGTWWSDTTFTEPRPFLDIAPPYGIRLQSTSSHWWLATPSGVWRATRPPAQPLDLTPYILTLTQEKPGDLTIVLDNSKGYFASPGEGPLASLRFRAEIQLRLGYRTTAGDEAVPAGAYWIDSWRHLCTDNKSLFTIVALDGWGLLDRWTARYQMRWNKDDVDPTCVWEILYQVLARVGIKLTNSPPKAQSSPILNLYPDFAINPGTPGTAAVRRLLSFVPDTLVMRGQEAFTKDLLAAEASCYSYGVGLADHKILAGEYTKQTTLSRARALGEETGGDRIVRDALDWTLLDLAIDEIEQVYDPNLQATSRTQERADAILRKNALGAKGGQITVPTQVGQQLLDVVQITDARCGIDQVNYRVQAIRTHYDRRAARYEHLLTLGAP